MGETWFTGYPDELARLLIDARSCADACEAHLAASPEAIDVLAAPAAVSQVLIDLIDQPPELVLAAVRLCRDLSLSAASRLGDATEVVASLVRVAESATALLDAAA
jgi:hypothetical protein